MSGYAPRPGFPGGGYQQPAMPPQPPGLSPAYSAPSATTAQNSNQLAGFPPGHQAPHQQQQMGAFAQPPFPSSQHQMANGGIPNGFPGMAPSSNVPNRYPQPPTMPPSAFQQPPRPQTNGFGNNTNAAAPTGNASSNFGPPLSRTPTIPSPSPPDPSPQGGPPLQPFAQQTKPHPPPMTNQSVYSSAPSNFQQMPPAMTNGPSMPRPPLPTPPVPGFQDTTFGQQPRPGFPPPLANHQPPQQQQNYGQSYPNAPMQPQMPGYPAPGYGQQQQPVNSMSQDFNRMGLGQQQQQQMIDLMQERQVLSGGCPDPHVTLPPTVINSEVNCDPE
uniref:Uncharacterized protein n=1 Tax=Plectus sambesii TaxID=2011161 RepID=A0A914XI93_9BILA